MYIIKKSFTFEASHQLHHHQGKCSNLHGHSYTLELELCSMSLHKSGSQKNMVTDFSNVSQIAKKLISSHLDHRHLNDTLQTDSPTAEFIAEWCFKRLYPSLSTLSSVTIHETASACATYRPNLQTQHTYFCPMCTHCTNNNNNNTNNESIEKEKTNGITRNQISQQPDVQQRNGFGKPTLITPSPTSPCPYRVHSANGMSCFER